MNDSNDCARISDLLPEFLAGRVSADDDAWVRAHLDECRDCRNRANAVSLLQQTPVPAPDPDRWDDFVDGVVDAADDQKRGSTTRRAVAAAAALVMIAGGVLVWQGIDRSGDDGEGLEALAREVSELSEEQAAAWTAGLVGAGWPSVGIDTSGLTEEQLQELVKEVERS